LVEPHKILEIDLTYNQAIVKLQPAKAKQYKKVGIPVSKENTIHQTSALGLIFYGPDKFQHEYYQNSFELDKIVERRLEIYKNMPLNKAIEGYKKIVSKLLNDLENEKGKLTSNFYNYIRAEIEFGARNQFLRFLMLDKKEEMDTFFSKEIPAEIMTLVSFDKTKVNHSTLISEEFNNFSEMYLNFLISIKHQKLIINEDFNREKIKTAIRNLPKASVYYYLANHLLQTNRKALMQIIKNEAAVEELITKTITKYPNGELNMKLIEKYDL
jgi:hypothetical protein